jgi:predicted Zn-dependent protease
VGCAARDPQFALLTLDEEWNLGRRLADEMATVVQPLNDPKTAAYADAMLERVLAAARGEYPAAARVWSLTVVHGDPDLFSVPGGHVYLTTGMVALTENYAELLAAVAHEVAHGLERNIAENLSRRYGIETVEDVVWGEDPETSEQIREQVLSRGGVLAYNRDAEREADRLVVGYLYKSGVDPLAWVDLLGRSREPGRRAGAFRERHGVDKRRAEAVREQVRALPPRPLTRDDSGYAAFRAAVAAAGSP